MRLTFPLRVRCVDPGSTGLMRGQEYEALSENHTLVKIRGVGNYYKARFKPVVRVQAKCVRGVRINRPDFWNHLFDSERRSRPCPARPDLDALLKRATEAYAAMTPADREAMLQKQRESWVRGQTGWDG